MKDLSRLFADLCADLDGATACTAGLVPGFNPPVPGESEAAGSVQAIDKAEISRSSRSENTQTISDDISGLELADIFAGRVARTSSYEKKNTGNTRN